MHFVGPLERALYLKTLPQLEELGSSEIAAFAEHAREKRFRRGAHILVSGKPVPDFHVVVEGRVRIQDANAEPIESGPRQTVGLLNLLARSEQGVDAVALEDTLTLAFDADVVADLMEDNFAIFIQLMRYLARRTLEERMEISPGAFLAPDEEIELEDGGSTDLNLVQRLLYVRRPGSIFEHSNLDALAEMVGTTEIVRIPEGTTLWASGDRSTIAYIILRGVVVCTPQWTREPFRCGPGYPLGNLERLCGEPRWYTAVTERRVLAIRSDLDLFLDVLEDHPDMAKDFLAAMAKNLIVLMGDNARRKIAQPQPASPAPSKSVPA
jgi:CRP-like cAMP-binding protein